MAKRSEQRIHGAPVVAARRPTSKRRRYRIAHRKRAFNVRQSTLGAAVRSTLWERCACPRGKQIGQPY